MVAGAVIFGLVGALALSLGAGSSADALPGVALGSVALLIAERTVALFAVWLVLVVVVVRALGDQLPVEISGRGVRYAEAGDLQATAASVKEALDGVDVEMRWLRNVAVELREAEDRQRGTGGPDGG